MRDARLALALAGAIIVVLAVPSLAAACTETYSGAATGANAWDTASNWTPTGIPGSSDDVCIQKDGTYSVTMPNPAHWKSLTLGTLTTGTVTLAISNGASNAGLTIDNGGSVNARGAITLDGAVTLDLRDSTLSSAGTVTTQGVANPTLAGHFVNTGTFNVTRATDLVAGVATPTATLVNQGAFAVANNATFEAHTSTSVTNDTNGSITTTGNAQFLSDATFNQGAGATTTSNNPVAVAGALNYTGNGASSILIYTGASLSGTSVAGQLLRIRADTINTNVSAGSGFNNGGTLTLDGSGANGSPHLNMGTSTLTNSGTIAVATGMMFAAPQIGGNLTNTTTGTLQVDANLEHTSSTGPTATLDNMGMIAIASGATLSSFSSNCGSGTVVVTNDVGGQIVATGTGTLVPYVYNQGAGTTSGTNPVTLGCGFLNYTGTGAPSHVLVSTAGNSGISMSGNVAAGQSLTVTNGTVAAGTFTNSGTITLDETTGGDGLSVGSGKLTNAASGTISVDGTVSTEIDGAQTFTNHGALLVNTNLIVRGAPNAYVCATVCLDNQGDVEIAAGKTLEVHNDFAQSAGTTNLLGTGAVLYTWSKVDLTGGTLSGVGTVEGPLNNGATVSPGPPGSPGTLTLNGPYTQSSGGTLTTRVSSSTSDRLTVNGAATLAGALSASTIGTPPAVGQTFIALSDTSQSGTFGTVGGSSSYDVVYHPTDVTLVAKTRPPAGSGPAATIDDSSVRNPGGDGTLTFTVRLSAAPGGTGASVQYATANGVAAAPADYASTSGTLSFGPAETQKTVTVAVHHAGAGPDRTLFVNLSNPVGATLAKSRGTGTILNDAVLVSSVTATSGGTCGVATVVLRGAGFTGSPAVRLTRANQADIVATSATPSAGGRVLTVTFDLNGAGLGAHDVIVTLPSFGAISTLPSSYTVEPNKPAILSGQLIGSSSSLPDYPWTGILQVANTGNVDATDAIVRIDGFQSGAAVKVLGSGFSAVELNSTSGHSIVITLNRVPALGSVQLGVRFVPIGPAHHKYNLPVTVISRGSGCGGGGAPAPPPPEPAPPADRVPPVIPPPFKLEILTAGDPNDKFGPQGWGSGHYVSPAPPLPYAVQFENMPTASAPAHEVRVTDQLDATKLDLSTLELGSVYFGDTLVSAPAHMQSWNATVDLRPARNLLVSISANLDPLTGLLIWDLKGIDPVTGEFVTDASRGWLPPDTAPPAGRGGVSFTVLPRPGLRTGDQVSNAASIVFDSNQAIATPTFTNTFDSTPPATRVRSVKPRRHSCRSLSVAYAKSDTGAGVDFLDVFASRNGGPFSLWRPRTTNASDVYSAKPGSYSFYSVGTDGAGNTEVNRKTPDLKARISCRGKACSVTSQSGFWENIVAAAAARGGGLTLRLRRVGLTSLRVLVNGHTRLSARRGRVPSTIRLSRIPRGDYVVSLVASSPQGTVAVDRSVNSCTLAAPRPKKHKH